MAHTEQEQKNRKEDELKKFVDKIARLFEAHELQSAEFLIPSAKDEKQGEHHPHTSFSGYLLRELSSFKMASSELKSKKERQFIQVVPEEEFNEVLKKSLVSSAAQTHRLTLKQDLHFDAFKKLLLEKGLVVKKVMDWKLHNTGKEVVKIKEWGKKYSSIQKNPSSIQKRCIIMRNNAT